MASGSSKLSIYAALAGNFLVAATKFAAALFTGSASMLSEGVHSLVDTANELLLLYGYRRAGKAPDGSHPLGYGRELYFWSFVVALQLFALGAAVSAYKGVLHVLEPTPIQNPAANYLVLALSFLFEAASWLIAVRQFRRTANGRSFWQAIVQSKDPPSFIVVVEDTAALLGICVAALGNFGATELDLPYADGGASMVIGLILGVTALVLARETKGLLIGERAGAEITEAIRTISERRRKVEKTGRIMTVHLAPDQIVVALDIAFADDLSTTAIETEVEALEAEIRRRHPAVVALFIKPVASRIGDKVA
ncbi:MAG TPA: cation diffusion facilitator family transporter [Ferrovibrio sp.]|uniref:cation diffusion facilitator family transporter n=1 Tax=Ferrovibrio sp. TaxID=1917215 RepID=UPI002ED17619